MVEPVLPDKCSHPTPYIVNILNTQLLAQAALRAPPEVAFAMRFMICFHVQTKVVAGGFRINSKQCISHNKKIQTKVSQKILYYSSSIKMLHIIASEDEFLNLAFFKIIQIVRLLITSKEKVRRK